MGSVIKDIISGLAALFRWKAKKIEVENSPAMQARAQGQTDQEIKDSAAAAIKRGDLGQIQKDLAE